MLDVRKLVAEFLGTLILVVVAVGVATESFGFKLFGGTFNVATGIGLNGSIAAGVVATALAFGLVLVALVYAIGPISGCHVNPAVTLGFIATGRMKLQEGVAYIAAQVVGGIAGAFLLYWMFTTSPIYSKSVQGLGTDGYGSKSILHVSEGGAFLIEVVLTTISSLDRSASNRWTTAAISPPTSGATMKSQTWLSAVLPTTRAGPRLRAGLTEVPVSGMPIRCTITSAKPMATPAAP